MKGYNILGNGFLLGGHRNEPNEEYAQQKVVKGYFVAREEALPPANAGMEWRYVDGQFTQVDASVHELLRKQNAMRTLRGIKLRTSDYTILPDSPLSGERKNAWKAYRQALRDITLQPSFAASGEVAWPTPPAN